MPLKTCTSGGKSGWKWGDSGHCYTGPGAKKKAIKQGIAIEGPDKFKKMASEDPEIFMADALDSLGLVVGFVHNSTLAKNEPTWGAVNKNLLPQIAFAETGNEDKHSTWKFPHHWVQGGKITDEEDGVYGTGTLYLHKGGLHSAWAAANGARSGEQSSLEVKAHLRKHMAAIGETKQATAQWYGVSEKELDILDETFIIAGLLTEEDLAMHPADKLSEFLVQE